jgi:hypothetical protein
METMTDIEKGMVESCSIIFSKLNHTGKLELMKRLLSSIKNDQTTLFDDFIPEKSAEEIISEIRSSRSFGRTRIIEPL